MRRARHSGRSHSRMEPRGDRLAAPGQHSTTRDVAIDSASLYPEREPLPQAGPPFNIRRSSKSADLSKEEQNESSPLIGPREAEDMGSLPLLSGVPSPNDDDDWNEDQTQETKSSWYLMLLTLAIGGLQIAWSVELAYGSPYLLGLGLSKSLLAFVWIAGPLSGTLVQPYVGIKSDRSRSKWGKRRPFIVWGAVATIVSLLCLAWAREIVAGFLHLFGVDREAKVVYTVAIVCAVLLIYVLDFAINVSKYTLFSHLVKYSTHRSCSPGWRSSIHRGQCSASPTE